VPLETSCWKHDSLVSLEADGKGCCDMATLDRRTRTERGPKGESSFTDFMTCSGCDVRYEQRSYVTAEVEKPYTIFFQW